MMASDLTPTMLRCVQRLTVAPRMAALANNTEMQLRNGRSVNLRQFATSFYPTSFLTGSNISISVLHWLFPSSSDTSTVVAGESVVKSPLGELTQIFVIAEGLLSHYSSVGCPEALEVLLAARVFVKDSESMTTTRRQHALDQAMRYTQDQDTFTMLIAHGADPQAVLEGFVQESPMPLTRVNDFRSNTAPMYADSGVFLVGNATLLPNHVIACCSLANAWGVVCTGVDTVRVLPTAAKHRRVDVLRKVCENVCVDIDYCPPRGTTAMIRAITSSIPLDRNGRLPTRLHVVGALIRLGADVNARGRHNETALMQATRRANTQTVELLLRQSANPNLCDDDGSSALHYAYRCGEVNRYSQQLLAHGADPNLLDAQGRTPLDLCRSSSTIDDAIELLSRAVDSDEEEHA